MAECDIPHWREVNTVEDFIIAVRDTLERWVLLHTDAECWAAEWAMDDVGWAFRDSKGEIGNDWFHFNWKAAVYREMAKEWMKTTQRCPECWMLIFEGWEHDCECKEENPDLEAVWCDESDLEDIEYFMEDCEIEPDENLMWDALVNEGFPVYERALWSTICGYVEEMKEAIEKLDEAIDNDDRWNMLTMAREATRIYHVNGQVMEDYGEEIGLPFRDVDTVRNEGFEALFSRDELRAFLEGD